MVLNEEKIILYKFLFYPVYYMKSVTQNLFEEYQKNRSTKFTIEQFRILLRLFPSLLVCMSDGNFNEEEKRGMLQNIQSNRQLFDQQDELEKDRLLGEIVGEMNYLAKDYLQWKELFLTAVRYELIRDPEEKEFILESLYLFANIHDGICIEEQLLIDELVNDLHLTV
jgi:tellurite resistance protein